MSAFVHAQKNRLDLIKLSVNNVISKFADHEIEGLESPLWYHPAILQTDNIYDIRLLIILTEYILYLNTLYMHYLRKGKDITNLNYKWENMLQVTNAAIETGKKLLPDGVKFTILDHPNTPNKSAAGQDENRSW